MAHKVFITLAALFALVPYVSPLAIDPQSAPDSATTANPFGRRHVLSTSLRRDDARHGSMNHVARDEAGLDATTLIGKLWKENKDLVDQFLNVKFLKVQADGQQNVTLPSYQYYSVQDYYYLIDYVQYKALRMTTYSELNPTQLLQVMTVEAEDISGDAEYAAQFRNETLLRDLAIPVKFVDERERATAEIAYADWLQKNLDLGWFTLHVMMIPCIYGWGQIASKLNASSTTNRNTVFYRTWIEPNNDPGYGQRLSDFLEANKAKYDSPDARKTWTGVFRQALRFEIDFFNSALNKTLEDLPK